MFDLKKIEIGKNIRFYRTLKEMSMDDLGKAIDVQKQTIQKYETGKIAKIPDEKIQKIAAVFEIEPKELTDVNAIDIFKLGRQSYITGAVNIPETKRVSVYKPVSYGHLKRKRRREEVHRRIANERVGTFKKVKF